MSAHPLRKDPKWRYEQPTVTVKSSFVAIGPDAPKGHIHAITGASSCREGTIHTLRRALRAKVTARTSTLKRGDYGYSWREHKHHLTHEIDLEDLRNKRAGRTTLSINKRAIGNRAYRKFLHVADAILGPIGVLINPDRPRNCCAASTTSRNVEERQLVWHGVDNTILYSPALVAMFAGLYRQCALLCKAGYADEILSVVDRSWIRETIQRADEESAREIIEELKRWIEVPIPSHAHKTNMVFPPGYFSRLLQVSRAVEKHGSETVFAEELMSSWGLTPGSVNGYGSARRGLWSAWGAAKEGNATYRKIAQLSKSRKRNRPACRD